MENQHICSSNAPAGCLAGLAGWLPESGIPKLGFFVLGVRIWDSEAGNPNLGSESGIPKLGFWIWESDRGIRSWDSRSGFTKLGLSDAGVSKLRFRI